MELHEEFKIWALIWTSERIRRTIDNQKNPVFKLLLRLFYYNEYMKTAKEMQIHMGSTSPEEIGLQNEHPFY